MTGKYKKKKKKIKNESLPTNKFFSTLRIKSNKSTFWKKKEKSLRGLTAHNN